MAQEINSIMGRHMSWRAQMVRAGMAIGSKLLSEQPARDRAEHGAMSNAVRLNSVLVRISILGSCTSLLLYISGFKIVVRKRVTFILYASSFQRNI